MFLLVISAQNKLRQGFVGISRWMQEPCCQMKDSYFQAFEMNVINILLKKIAQILISKEGLWLGLGLWLIN